VRNSVPRFILAALLIVAAAILLYARGGEKVKDHIPLKQFPAQLADWSGIDIPIDPDTLDVLGDGDFLHRLYQSESEPTDVDLFIAYFPTQSAGDTIHSPKNCLPGSGWGPVDSRLINLSLPGHVPFPATRYVVAKGDLRRVVLYWYWAHNRGVASEYWAKYYLVKDSIQMNRSDGALVRITTPILANETPDAAQQRILPFVTKVFPRLNEHIPR
jgi:EpsI family protein